ncbi:enoyl-CoA hydratase/isomerase family protein [Alsobacter metallidurans]|uniref:enoyl-CoA hydratase/isomerase family protein n=1 Tax=Alsobacter metallidurans TaxID=340221 RepID=UPI001662E54E|nr:enoyl-CoA hydratase/isomerase family protein [Alsobacter metallidurans]
MADDNLLVKTGDGRAWVTFNRPDKFNPLDWATLKELRRAVEALDANPAVRAVVFTGAGRAFSAGGDLAGYLSLYADKPAFRLFLDDFAAVCGLMERSSTIFIAAVNGTCVAGGLELLLACDLAFAADTARIGDGHVNFAQIPGAGGSQRLARAIGPMRAKHLMLSGRLLDAREAERIGLVAEVAPADALAGHVNAFVDDLVQRSATVLASMKKLVNDTRTLEWQAGLDAEMDVVHAYATGHPDAMEGLRAFAEKRRPHFAAD